MLAHLLRGGVPVLYVDHCHHVGKGYGIVIVHVTQGKFALGLAENDINKESHIGKVNTDDRTPKFDTERLKKIFTK